MTYPGLVKLDQDSVQVTVGLETGKVRLVSGGVEVGLWSDDECVIRANGAGTWLIEAESERLPFIPDDPEQFAADVVTRGGQGRHETIEPEPVPASSRPKALTLIGFYLLATATTGLGIWAFISLF